MKHTNLFLIIVLIVLLPSCKSQTETLVIEEAIMETQESVAEWYDGSEPAMGNAVDWLLVRSPGVDLQPIHTYHDFLTQISEPDHITIGFQGDLTIDPAKTWPWEFAQASDLLFLGLTRIDPETGEVLPELAIEWEQPTEFGVEWVLVLRDDISWVDRDGKIVAPVTAHDAVFAIQRALDRRTKASSPELLYIIENAEEVHALEQPTQEDLESIGVWAEDDTTLKIRLVEEASYFPVLLSLPIMKPVPKQLIEEQGEGWIESGEYWSNGPYLFAHLTPEEVLVLCEEITENCSAINPHYHDLENIKIAAISLLSYSSAEDAVESYIHGDLDFFEVYSRDWELILNNPDLIDDIHPFQDYGTASLGFNTSKPPLDNVLVRQALAHSIDREMLIATSNQPWNIPATTLTPPIMAPREKLATTLHRNLDQIAYDPQLAREKFEEAGYPEGAGFPELTLAVRAFRPEHEEMVEKIAETWNQVLGIDIEIAAMDIDIFYEQLEQDPPDLFLTFWYADYPDPHAMLFTHFHSTKGANWIQWSNSQFDQLTSQAAAEPDPAIRWEKYKKAEKLLTVDEAGIIPIYYYTRVALVRSELEIENIPAYAGSQGWHLWKVKAH
jgi:oligopeptide transport system substrate-binding protein